MQQASVDGGQKTVEADAPLVSGQSAPSGVALVPDAPSHSDDRAGSQPTSVSDSVEIDETLKTSIREAEQQLQKDSPSQSEFNQARKALAGKLSWPGQKNKKQRLISEYIPLASAHKGRADS
jgi:hypothetical protein